MAPILNYGHLWLLVSYVHFFWNDNPSWNENDKIGTAELMNWTATQHCWGGQCLTGNQGPRSIVTGHRSHDTSLRLNIHSFTHFECFFLVQIAQGHSKNTMYDISTDLSRCILWNFQEFYLLSHRCLSCWIVLLSFR